MAGASGCSRHDAKSRQAVGEALLGIYSFSPDCPQKGLRGFQEQRLEDRWRESSTGGGEVGEEPGEDRLNPVDHLRVMSRGVFVCTRRRSSASMLLTRTFWADVVRSSMHSSATVGESRSDNHCACPARRCRGDALRAAAPDGNLVVCRLLNCRRSAAGWNTRLGYGFRRQTVPLNADQRYICLAPSEGDSLGRR